VNERQKVKGKRQEHQGSTISFTLYLVPFTLALALALRLLLWSAPLHLPANDEVEYITVARDLLAGRGWQFYDHYHWLRAPLYPLFLAGSLWLAGGDLHAAALPNIALSVATVYLAYRLAMALFGRRGGVPLLAALMSAILWTLATFASLYMSETLFTFLFTGGLLCLVPEQGTKNREQGPSNDEPIGQHYRTQKHVPLAMPALAGVLFGLATLTRSITLLFLPIVALWLLLRTENRELRTKNQEPRTRSAITRRAILCSLLFVLCSLLTIAPWTIRNYQAYGRAAVVETGLSYNLWAFNEPREGINTIFRTLENIANPAERSDYATAKGLARLREDPAILLRKLWPNWVYLWRVKPIEDRFIQENYYSDVGLPLFAAALVFDDLLYVVLALAGIAGLVLYQEPRTKNREPRTGNSKQSSENREKKTTDNGQQTTDHRRRTTICNPKWLLIAWLLYTIGTMLLTHGEARYRHFLFPVLIPYAAWALVNIVDCRLQIVDWKLNLQSAIYNLQSEISLRYLLVLACWALFAGTFMVAYPWGWAAQNLVRGWYAAQAEIAWARGDRAQALLADQQALAAQETPDGWLRLAAHRHATGDTRGARNAYNAARTLARSYLPGVATFGDFLRATGDETKARAVFSTDDVDQERLLDWSWRELRPTPRASLEIGDGLDWGYITGAYPAETIQGAQARWTNGAAQIRFGAAPAGVNQTTVLVRLRLAGLRPDGAPAMARICARDQCWDVQITATWRNYTVGFDTAGGVPLIVELRSDTFDAADGRRLGVLVDEAELKRIGEE
jgi:hypothetical protein